MTLQTSWRTHPLLGAPGQIDGAPFREDVVGAHLRAPALCTPSEVQPLQREINRCPPLTTENGDPPLGTRARQGPLTTLTTSSYKRSSADNVPQTMGGTGFCIYSLSAVDSPPLIWVDLFSKPKCTARPHPPRQRSWKAVPFRPLGGLGRGSAGSVGALLAGGRAGCLLFREVLSA